MCPRQPGDDGTARQWPGARSVPGQPVTSPWAGRLRSGESRATHEGWGLSSRVWFWWLNAWVQWGPKKQSPKKTKHTSVFHRQIRDHRTNGAIKLTESGVGFPRSGRTAKRRGQWEAPALRLAVGGGRPRVRTRHAHATHTRLESPAHSTAGSSSCARLGVRGFASGPLRSPPLPGRWLSPWTEAARRPSPRCSSTSESESPPLTAQPGRAGGPASAQGRTGRLEGSVRLHPRSVQRQR